MLFLNSIRKQKLTKTLLYSLKPQISKSDEEATNLVPLISHFWIANRKWLEADGNPCWHPRKFDRSVDKDAGSERHGPGDEGLGWQCWGNCENAAQTSGFSSDESCCTGQKDFRFLWCWLAVLAHNVKILFRTSSSSPLSFCGILQLEIGCSGSQGVLYLVLRTVTWPSCLLFWLFKLLYNYKSLFAVFNYILLIVKFLLLLLLHSSYWQVCSVIFYYILLTDKLILPLLLHLSHWQVSCAMSNTFDSLASLFFFFTSFITFVSVIYTLWYECDTSSDAVQMSICWSFTYILYGLCCF